MRVQEKYFFFKFIIQVITIKLTNTKTNSSLSVQCIFNIYLGGEMLTAVNVCIWL